MIKGTRMMMKQKVRSPNFTMRHIGDGGPGFIVSGIGEASLPLTITLWYRYAEYPTQTGIWSSRLVVKYGDSSTGCGFGTLNFPGTYAERAELIEAKYWAYFSLLPTENYTDVSWHHLALVVKSGTYPWRNAVFVDGIPYQTAEGGQSAGMSIPSGQFSLCGRNGDGWPATVDVSRACVFQGELTETEVVQDMAMGSVPPADGNLIHFWNGTTDSGVVKDIVGDWDLTQSVGCQILEESPWS